MLKKIILTLIFAFFIFNEMQGQEQYRGYRGILDIALGDAYNLNSAQKISTNNMQWYGEISTTHGYVMNN